MPGPNPSTTITLLGSPLSPSPLGFHRSRPHLLKQVEDSKYIDLGDFLPDVFSYAFDRLREGKEDKVSGKKFPITSIT